MTITCRYPDIEVELVGTDGNAFAILGTVKKALQRGLVADGSYTAGEIADQVRQFMDEAMSGDYDHLLQTCMKWVSVS
jgi:hypothetical protein